MTSSQARVRYATAEETGEWDQLIAANPAGADFNSMDTFAGVKEQYGWKPRRLIFESDALAKIAILVLERKVPLLGKLWYVARGPAVSELKELQLVVAALKDFISKNERQVFALTFEPPIKSQDLSETSGPAPAELQALGAVRRPAIQGNTNTVIIPLQKTDDELIAGFDKKCRNMIRRAIRDGATVEKVDSTPKTFTEMHRLMRLVGGGNADLILRPKEYTEALWSGFSNKGQGQFYAINVDGEPVVMGLLLILGDRAFYKDGGSERPKTTPGMANLLVWQMMLDARDAGAKEIDLVGIAPAWAKSTAEHVAYGLGLFKLSFSSERTDYIGAFDIPLKGLNYRIWKRIGERVVGKLHREKYKDTSMY